MNKSLGIIIVIALVLGIGGWVYYENKDEVPSPAGGTYEAGSPESSTSDTPAETSGTSLPPAGFTFVQVSGHKTSSDCWTAINGSVYNLTSWIAQHPGGEQAIIQLCGTDGSAKFNAQHGGQANPAAALATFRIGALIK